MMKYRKFGSLGIDVSIVGFGGGAISGEGGGYGFGDISSNDAVNLLRKALDSGINLFDTAPIYGFGESERRMGLAFKGMREKVFLVSKSGVHWDAQKKNVLTNDPKITAQMLEQSLRDLQTDYIDLYMIHWPDPQVDIRRPMEVLANAKASGKIRAIGLSNTHADDLAKAMSVARVDVLQAEFNLFIEHPPRDLFPLVRRHKLGFMSWGTLDKGIITGRVHEQRSFDASDARSRAPWWLNSDRSWKYRAMSRIQPLLDDAGLTGLHLALASVLSYEEVSTALCGAKNLDQLDSLVAASESLPSSELIAACRNIVDEERPRA